MAHHTVRSGYEALVERLNRLPQGAPPSDTLYATLKLLEGDALAPTLGPEWREAARESHVAANGLPFAFVTYRRAGA